MKNEADEVRAIKAYRKKQQKEQLAKEVAAREAVQAHQQKRAAMRLEQQRKRDKSAFKTKLSTKTNRISALVHLEAGSSSDAADQRMSPPLETPKRSADTAGSIDLDGSRAWIRVGRGRWREASLLEAEHVPDHVSPWNNEEQPTSTELLTHDGRWHEFLRQEASRQRSGSNVSHQPLSAAAAVWCLEELE